MTTMSTSMMNMDPSLRERVSHALENVGAMDSMRGSTKRKRDALDQGDGNQIGLKRGANQTGANGTSNDFNVLTEQLAQGMGAGNGQQSQIDFNFTPQMSQVSVPQPADISFAQTTSTSDADRPIESSFALSTEGHPNNDENFRYDEPYVPPPSSVRDGVNGSPSKPAVGTDEWHKQRKDNHKEVERRRRETINEGINEIAKIVPGCGKNKGEILSHAVNYITQLKTKCQGNDEKWNMEKAITDQAIAALSNKIEEQRLEIEQQRLDIGRYRRMLQGSNTNMLDAGGGEEEDSKGMITAEPTQ